MPSESKENQENKWEKLHNKHHVTSFIKVDKPHQGNNNIVEDWNRHDMGPTLINGRPLDTIIREYKGIQKDKVVPPEALFFEDKEELQKFFKEHLLKDIPEDKIECALGYLMKTLHQGGLYAPVSSAAYEQMAEIYKEKKGEILGPCDFRRSKTNEDEEEIWIDGKTIKAQERQVNFTTSKDGFTVQEISIVREMLAVDTELNPKTIRPDAGQDAIYIAQATLKVDFSNEAPSITVKSNTISYGNKEIKELLDGRNFITSVIDSIKNVLQRVGFKFIEDLSKSVDEIIPSQSLRR